MRKLIYSIMVWFVINNLYAQETKENSQELFLQQYKEAILLYKKKEYEKAYERLNILFETNLDNANINFYLGRSAYELQKYHEAIIAYERVLFAKPESKRAQLEMARAYFMAGQYEEAKKYFLKLHTSKDISLKLKKAIEKFLVTIDENIQKNFVNGILLAGVQYDSNIYSRSEFDAFDIPGIPISANNSVENANGYAHQEVVIINHKYVVDDTTTIKNDTMAFSKSYFQNTYSDNDIKLLSYSPTYEKHYFKDWKVEYSVFADALWIDNSSNLRSYGVFPKVTYLGASKVLTQLHFKYQKKKYQKRSDQNKNSTYKEAAMNFKFPYSKKLGFGLGVFYANEKKENSSVADVVDKNSYRLKASSSYSLTSKLSFAPQISYNTSYYKDYDTFNQKYRQDKEYKIAVMSTYALTPKWLFQVGGDYSNVNSNIQVNTYHKHTFTFNIIKAF